MNVNLKKLNKMNVNLIFQAENAERFKIKLELLQSIIGQAVAFEYLQPIMTQPHMTFDIIIQKIDEKLLALEREAKSIETELNAQVKPISKETIQYLEAGFSKFRNKK